MRNHKKMLRYIVLVLCVLTLVRSNDDLKTADDLNFKAYVYNYVNHQEYYDLLRKILKDAEKEAIYGYFKLVDYPVPYWNDFLQMIIEELGYQCLLNNQPWGFPDDVKSLTITLRWLKIDIK